MYNKKQLARLNYLLHYSKKYQISIQFWPEDEVAVFVMKDDVHLYNVGGDFNYAIEMAIDYMDRITKKP